MLQTKQKR